MGAYLAAQTAHQINFKYLDRDKRIKTVKNLAHDLMTSVGRVIPVTPVSLISTVFVENPEKQFSDFEIAARVQELLLNLEKNKAQIYIPRKDWSYAIQVGLRMLILRLLSQLRKPLPRYP